MRKPPIPRAVPHRPPRERWAAAGACGVLVLGHATRAAVDSQHVAYLTVLDSVGVIAAAGVGVQLALVDDAISWYSAAGVAALLGSASIVSLTVGFPGTNPQGLSIVGLVSLVASVFVVYQAVAVLTERRRLGRDAASAGHPSAATRPGHLRRPRPAHHVARARQGTAPVRATRRDPARPAA